MPNEAEGAQDLSPALSENQASNEGEHPFLFTGSAKEFFKIWIVNLFLTIVTVGIYSAWAKVRTRRYFYANTLVNGHPFDYLANPVNILKGHLIVASLFIAYSLVGRFAPAYAFIFIGFFYLILPYLLYKSIRFYTHNSAYRNIRFNFDGTLWESYQLYLLAPILIPLTLGLYFPYWFYLQKRWFFEGAAFGSTFNDFEGRSGQFYKIYFLAGLLVIALMILAGIVIGLAGAAFGGFFDSEAFEKESFVKFGFAMAFGIYAVMLIGSAMVQQYVYAKITNYCWEKSKIGSVRVISALKARKLIWIRITNGLAIICSLGLAMPWAKVRRTKYILSCMRLRVAGSFDAFTAATGKDVSAVGDAAIDFFDFEIGL